jgi:integrase
MKSVSTQLFLSDATGKPLSAQRLYEAWTVSPRIPYKGWSPHCGRHYWACKTLLRHAVPLEQATLIAGAYGDDHSPLISSAIDTINLIIRPQLGHVDEDTTQAYLVWLRRVVMLTSISDEYGRYLGDF